MATKKTVSATVTAVTADAPAPAPAPAPTTKKTAFVSKEMSKAEMRVGAMKEVGLALGNDAKAHAHWKHAGVAYATIYDSRESMSSDVELKKSFFNLVSEKFGFSDALATKVARGCDTPEALVTKKQKSAARATQGTYWSRLLNYSFPAKKEKGPQHGGADGEADEAETEAQKVLKSKSKFEGLIDDLSDVIKGLEALEDAPKRANLVQALKELHCARAHLRGI